MGLIVIVCVHQETFFVWWDGQTNICGGVMGKLTMTMTM